jgi:hypothetical protein
MSERQPDNGTGAGVRSAVHGFWPAEFLNGGLGASH